MHACAFAGVMLMTDRDEPVGQSTTAAQEGISKVVLSRIGMAAPGMVRDGWMDGG